MIDIDTKGIEALIVLLYKEKWKKDDLTLRDVLYELYVNQEKSIRTIAKELCLTPTTVHGLLKRNYIPMRGKNGVVKIKW